ncbi:hypothetical protein E4U30_000642, partial [Claviceps sp. LM220 group G6]
SSGRISASSFCSPSSRHTISPSSPPTTTTLRLPWMLLESTGACMAPATTPLPYLF